MHQVAWEKDHQINQKVGEAAILIPWKKLSEEEEKASIQSEAFEEEVHSKKGGKLKNGESPSLITVEKIQDLIANTVKAQLGGSARKTHLYTKPYTKRVDALCMPRG